MVGKNLNVGTPEAENKEENIKRFKLMFFGNIEILKAILWLLKTLVIFNTKHLEVILFVQELLWDFLYAWSQNVFHISLTRKYCLRVWFLNANLGVSSNKEIFFFF